MEPIVIRNDRKRLIKILLLLLIPLILGIFFLLAPDHPNPARRMDTLERLIGLPGILVACFFGFFLLKAIVINPPVLIFEQNTLSIRTGDKLSVIPWDDITEWRIELGTLYTSAEGISPASLVNYILFITTTTGKEVIGIERLTISADEIYELMQRHKS